MNYHLLMCVHPWFLSSLLINGVIMTQNNSYPFVQILFQNFKKLAKITFRFNWDSQSSRLKGLQITCLPSTDIKNPIQHPVLTF